MSATTIQIPADHVDAIHQSLVSRRDVLGGPGQPGASGEIEEIDGLIRQLEPDPQGQPDGCRVTGSRRVLWSAIYDSTCATAERLAECCNDYWQRPDLGPARAEISLLSSRLDLLEEVGSPPSD